MDKLLKKILEASGISGYEGEIAKIMKEELKKSCDEVKIDNFGNVIARKGKGKTKIMIAAHMDEIGFMVKHITKEGYIHFIKIGGIDDRILPAQKVIIKAKKGKWATVTMEDNSGINGVTIKDGQRGIWVGSHAKASICAVVVIADVVTPIRDCPSNVPMFV